MDHVRLKSPGWGFSNTEHEGLRVSPSTADFRFSMSIRPDEVFYIGRMTFSVHVRQTKHLGKSEEIQVTSSGHNGGITQDKVDLEGELFEESRETDQAGVLNLATKPNYRSSTPTMPSSRPLAVMETPTAIRVCQLDSEPAVILSSIDGSSMKDLPVLGDAANAKASDRLQVGTDIARGDTRGIMQQQTTSGPDATDQQPSSTTDEDSRCTSPTQKSEVSEIGPNLLQDNMRSTIQVEIPTRRGTSSNAMLSSRRRNSRSTQDSAEPTSSSRSMRSNLLEDSSSLSLAHTNLKVMFASSTSSDKSPQFRKFLKKQGVKTVKSVADCTILCVGKGAELKKTSNLILAVASGKEIVTDEWISRSAIKGELLDSHDFPAKDPKREAEWGTTLSDAIERGRQGTKPFHGYTIYFTSAAKQELGKGFSDIKDIAVFAGAECIKVAVPRKSSEGSPMTMVIAVNDDDDLPALEERSWKTYTKEIITISVLRGSLDLDSEEFLLTPRAVNQNGKSRKRKR